MSEQIRGVQREVNKRGLFIEQFCGGRCLLNGAWLLTFQRSTAGEKRKKKNDKNNGETIEKGIN